METTIHENFVRTSNLRRRMSRPDAHPVIQEVFDLYERTYSRGTDRNPMADSAPEHENSAKTEYPFVAKESVAHLTIRNCTYSTSSAHSGNSAIMYHPMGDRTCPAVPGIISRIDCHDRDGDATFKVRPLKMSNLSAQDPFAIWKHFRASTWSRKHSKHTQEPFDWVAGQAVVYDLDVEDCVVILVSRVSLLRVINS
jgi:hypothetical protein